MTIVKNSKEQVSIPFKTALLSGSICLTKRYEKINIALSSAMFSNDISLDKKKLAGDLKKLVEWLES